MACVGQCQRNPLYEGYRHIPTGSLWISEPSFARENTAEDWAVAAEFLRDFHLCAVRVNDVLDNAVVDAQQRCWEEHQRASEREATPEADKDRFGLSPGEQERLKALLDRCDVLNNAATLITQYVPEGAGQREAVLEELEALAGVLHDEFGQYRRELGVPERGRLE